MSATPWPTETIPVLRVSDAAASAAWYRRLGFTVEWVHRFEPHFPAFVSVAMEGPGTRLFLSEHTGDAPGPALVWIRVADVAPVAAEFGVEAHAYGARVEVSLVDPDGNRITVGAMGESSERHDEEYRYELG
jgi:catechol 2,3-dioxygenase-like lactoylglutathione lyase family enzyme